jgi:4'-phosphopantetheinyl transferase
MLIPREAAPHFLKAPEGARILGEGLDVWRIFPDLPGETVLSGEESARAHAYLSAPARNLFIAGRSGIRRIASLYTRMPPADLQIAVDVNGKPFFENADLHFNLSHSGAAIVAAFSSRPVGIDIESFGRCRDFLSIARRFFHPEEADAIAASRDEGDFLRLWTAKESMLKLSGEGLSGGLEEARPRKTTGSLLGRTVHLVPFHFEKFLGTVASFEPLEVKGWFQIGKVLRFS